MKDGDWAEYGRRDHAGRRAARSNEGVRLVYHHHMGTIVESEADIDAFMSATGRGRASAARHRPRHLGRRRSGGPGARAIATRISHVHTKDVRKAVMEQAEGGGLELPRFRARRASTRCRATAWSISSPCSANCRAIRGWVVIEAEQDPEEGQSAHLCQDGLCQPHPLPEGSRTALTTGTMASRMSEAPASKPMPTPDDRRTGASIPSRRPRPAGPMSASTSTGSRRPEPRGKTRATGRPASSCSPARRRFRPAARISASSAGARRRSSRIRGRSMCRRDRTGR